MNSPGASSISAVWNSSDMRTVPGIADVDDAVGQVDRGAEVVAVAEQDRAVGQADPDVGEQVVVGVRVGQVESDAGRVGHVVDDEHDLVADHLDDPAPGAGHDVVGDLLEAAHHGGQLLVAQVLAEEREADHVGESDRQHRALPGREPVAAQHHAALDPCCHLAPPDELEQLRHGGDGHVGDAGEGVRGR